MKEIKLEKYCNDVELLLLTKVNEIIEVVNSMNFNEEIINVEAPKKDYCNIAMDINILRKKGLEGWRLVAIDGKHDYYLLERDIYSPPTKQ